MKENAYRCDAKMKTGSLYQRDSCQEPRERRHAGGAAGQLAPSLLQGPCKASNCNQGYANYQLVDYQHWLMSTLQSKERKLATSAAVNHSDMDLF